MKADPYICIALSMATLEAARISYKVIPSGEINCQAHTANANVMLLRGINRDSEEALPDLRKVIAAITRLAEENQCLYLVTTTHAKTDDLRPQLVAAMEAAGAKPMAICKKGPPSKRTLHIFPFSGLPVLKG
jgi:hypothetical protein